MLAVVRFGHENLYVLSYDFFGFVTENTLGRRVETLNDTPVIYGDNAVDYGIQNGLEPRRVIR
jgi:hypothetical protein